MLIQIAPARAAALSNIRSQHNRSQTRAHAHAHLICIANDAPQEAIVMLHSHWNKCSPIQAFGDTSVRRYKCSALSASSKRSLRVGAASCEAI